MSDRNTIARCLAHAVRRWLPGAEGSAGAGAAAGNPSALLDLEADVRRHDDAAGAE